MSRIAAEGTVARVPATCARETRRLAASSRGYLLAHEDNVLAVLRAGLGRNRVLLGDRADAPLTAMRRFFSLNSLSVFFLVILLATLAGQAIAGHDKFNDDAMAHHEPTISLGRYVTSSSFVQAVMENWQSEYLQFS